MNKAKTTEKIIKAANRLGYIVLSSHRAETGTVYIELTRDGIDVTVRVADHAEAYAPRRPHRKLCVSPQEMSAADAIAALADPASIETAESAEIPGAADWVREQAAIAAQQKSAWKALRERLTAEDVAEFRRLGGNRPAARAVAARLGTKVAVTYSALTNGRRFQK